MVPSCGRAGCVMPLSTTWMALVGESLYRLVFSDSWGRTPKLLPASTPLGSARWQAMQAPWYRR